MHCPGPRRLPLSSSAQARLSSVKGGGGRGTNSRFLADGSRSGSAALRGDVRSLRSCSLAPAAAARLLTLSGEAAAGFNSAVSSGEGRAGFPSLGVLELSSDGARSESFPALSLPSAFLS